MNMTEQNEMLNLSTILNKKTFYIQHHCFAANKRRLEQNTKWKGEVSETD